MTAPVQDYFLTVEKAVRGPELKVKGSRFIPDIFPVTTKQEIEETLNQIRKEFHDATHHCYAYRLGNTGAILRAADDGEPSGTAGKPILLTLTNAALTNTLLVVTRYFGGTMLGTGGLARAYSETAKQGIAAAIIETVYLTDAIRLTVSYEDFPLVERVLSEFETKAPAPSFADVVSLTINIRKSLSEIFTSRLTDALSGRVTFSPVPAEKPVSE